MYTKFAMSLCLFHLGNPPRGRILQVCTLLLHDDRQVPLLLHAHHCFIQAFLQRSEFQAQVLEPLIGELERLRHWLAVVLTPRKQERGFRSQQRVDTAQHGEATETETETEGARHGANELTWP